MEPLFKPDHLYEEFRSSEEVKAPAGQEDQLTARARIARYRDCPVPVFKETNAMSFVQKFLNIAGEQARHVKTVKKVESK